MIPDVEIVGIVLAAGAGRRMGLPKGLLRTADGTTFAATAVELLREAGCAHVLVTVGARAEEVRAGLPAGAVVVDVPDWAEGPGAGISRALQHPLAERADAVLLTLVDLPRVTLDGVRAVLAASGREALVRAVDGGRPGHPVLIGREHRQRALEIARSGLGLKTLFTGPGVVTVEVVGAAADVDEPGDLPPGNPFTPNPT